MKVKPRLLAHGAPPTSLLPACVRNALLPWPSVQPLLNSMLKIYGTSCTCEGPSPVRIEPCTAAPYSILHQGCRPVRLLGVAELLDPGSHFLGFRSSFPQAPVAPFFRSIPLPRRRFSTGPMDFGSSSCKAPRSVLGQRAEQSMLRKESQSQWWPVLQVDYLQLPSVSCAAASIFLPCCHLRAILQLLLVRVSRI